jgi:hypothetical protein
LDSSTTLALPLDLDLADAAEDFADREICAASYYLDFDLVP